MLAVLAGEHVIVATPTGSGKSMVALGAHLAVTRLRSAAPGTALRSRRLFRKSSLTCAPNSGLPMSAC